MFRKLFSRVRPANTRSQVALRRAAIETLESRQLLSATLQVTDNSGTTTDLNLDFPDTTVGQNSSVETFTLTNTGDADLDVTSFAHTGDFTVTVKDNTSAVVNTNSFTIGAGLAFTVGVVFSPQSAADLTGGVTFDTNDAGNASVALTEAGTGIAAPSQPDAPSGMFVNAVLYNRINMAWTDNSDNENGFHIYQSTSANSGFALIQTLGANTRNTSVTAGITPGVTYFYQVKAFNNLGESAASQDFDVVPARPVDTAGNTLAKARNLGTLASPLTINEFIGSIDATDYYKFKLTAATTLNLTLTQLVDDADLQLLKLSTSGTTGTQVAISENAGSSNESITKKLVAGTYAIRVLKGGSTSNTSYRLGINPDFAGNATTSARAITLGTTAKSFGDFVGAADKLDFYKFTLTASKTVTLLMTKLKADADIFLLNKSGKVIASSENDGVTNESIIKKLAAGTYFIKVLQFADTTYRLTTSAK